MLKKKKKKDVCGRVALLFNDWSLVGLSSVNESKTTTSTKSSEGYREITIWVFNVDLKVKVLAVSQWFHRRPLDAAKYGSLEPVGAEATGRLARSTLEPSTCIWVSFPGDTWLEWGGPTWWIFLVWSPSNQQRWCWSWQDEDLGEKEESGDGGWGS